MSSHIQVSTVLTSVPTEYDFFFGPKAGLDAPDKTKSCPYRKSNQIPRLSSR